MSKPNPLAAKNSINKNSLLWSLSHSYILRQGVNYVTAILVQIFYLFVNVSMKSRNPYDTFLSDGFIVKIIPIIVLSLLFVNVIFNIFLLVLEIKFMQIPIKTKLILSKIF
jgi:hypothetical protein